ncbi:hypothetical protein [Candidatus Venteria ishoeyi]|uniref:Uncharacterized protein n=1 Tax=Candidatus Venteria ishoeyi TaxID=1899563 RepID=A0A1H6FGL1_9GAMM|nr:hypothetical protein [Candidatus Venteria ishoeyi]SEH08793.1 Uncharacterised protein [Candidatus Venteria ishoeyi]
MTYDVIALACEQLSYRDKLRLAQLLIQTARKEEETANPQNRVEANPVAKNSKAQETPSTENIDDIEYIVERLLKLKPTKKKSLTNSIKSMFQFQGGISEKDIIKVISKLQKCKVIKLEQNNVSYL